MKNKLVLINKINRCPPIDVLLEKHCIKSRLMIFVLPHYYYYYKGILRKLAKICIQGIDNDNNNNNDNEFFIKTYKI